MLEGKDALSAQGCQIQLKVSADTSTNETTGNESKTYFTECLSDFNSAKELR